MCRCQLEILFLSLSRPCSTLMPTETEHEKAGLARCVCSATANRPRLLCFPEHRVQDSAFWCETSWLEGDHWLIPKPTAVPAKPQRRLCDSGASFGAIPQHNACLYLSISSRNTSLWFSQRQGWTHWMHRCRMAVCLCRSSISSH